MNAAELQILRHSLGLRDDGSGRAYRNHFVTGEGSTDYPHCMSLVEQGFMVRKRGSPLSGGDDIFHVTDSGRAASRNRRRSDGPAKACTSNHLLPGPVRSRHQQPQGDSWMRRHSALARPTVGRLSGIPVVHAPRELAQREQ